MPGKREEEPRFSLATLGSVLLVICMGCSVVGALALGALGLIMAFSVGGVAPGLTICFVGVVLAGVVAWVTISVFRRHAADERAIAAAGSITCPSCGENDVVRGRGDIVWHRRVLARCLTCGHRWRIEWDVWQALPPANPGDPYETYAERWEIASRTHLTLTRLGALVILMVLAGAVTWVTVRFIGPVQWLPRPLTVGITFGLSFALAQRVWTTAFPPPRRPGRRCVKCGYDLHGTTEPRCPECGTPRQETPRSGP